MSPFTPTSGFGSFFKKTVSRRVAVPPHAAVCRPSRAVPSSLCPSCWGGGGQLCRLLLDPLLQGPCAKFQGLLRLCDLAQQHSISKALVPRPPTPTPPAAMSSCFFPFPLLSLRTCLDGSSLAAAAVFPPVSRLCPEPRLAPPKPCRLPACWHMCHPGCFPEASHDSPVPWTLGTTGQDEPICSRVFPW